MKTNPPNKMPKRLLLTFDDPRLLFAYGQKMTDPKDGLTLFGPPESPVGTRFGVIGTAEGIRQLEAWAAKLQRPVPADPNVSSSVMFPGFETVFRAGWNPEPRVKI